VSTKTEDFTVSTKTEGFTVSTKTQPAHVANNYGRQAITTKYLGPTDVRGSRVKATAEAGSVTLSWDDALGLYENHSAAAIALANKFNWGGTWYGGGTADGYVFVDTEV
jgi:hypothetical protein